MYEDIKKNKIKTGCIVFTFLLVITLIVYYVCNALDFGNLSIVIALTFSIISTIATYYNCDKIILASVKARPATREEDLQLVARDTASEELVNLTVSKSDAVDLAEWLLSVADE